MLYNNEFFKTGRRKWIIKCIKCKKTIGMTIDTFAKEEAYRFCSICDNSYVYRICDECKKE